MLTGEPDPELLEAYRQANRKKKLVSDLRVNRLRERETTRSRRFEEAAGDTAASRIASRREDAER